MHLCFWLLLIPVALMAPFVLWYLLGKYAAVVIDRFFYRRRPLGDSSPFLLDGDTFTFGACRRSFSGQEIAGLSLEADGEGCMVLTLGGRRMLLGPISRMWDDPVHAQYAFLPGPGDEVSVVEETGRFFWPAPFRINIFGGPSPSRVRYVYTRLRWKKRTGECLEIVWRSEAWFYPKNGWSSAYNMRVIRARITGGAKG